MIEATAGRRNTGVAFPSSTGRSARRQRNRGRVGQELEAALTQRSLSCRIRSNPSLIQARAERLVDLSLTAIRTDRSQSASKVHPRRRPAEWRRIQRCDRLCARTRRRGCRLMPVAGWDVIPRIFTVYLDLWLCDLEGNVICQCKDPSVTAVIGELWGIYPGSPAAARLASGDDYAGPACPGRQEESCIDNVDRCCTKLRQPSREKAKGAWRPLGVTIAIYFELGAAGQRAIVDGCAHRPRRAPDLATSCWSIRPPHHRRIGREGNSERRPGQPAHRPTSAGHISRSGRTTVAFHATHRLRDLCGAWLVRRHQAPP